MKFIFIPIISFFVAFSFSSPVKANVIGNFEKDAINHLGETASKSYTVLIDSIKTEANNVTKALSKYMSGFLASLYAVYFIFKVVQIVFSKGNLLSLAPNFFTVMIIFALIKNMTIFNNIATVPLLKTYELFGGVISTINNSSSEGIIKEITNSMSTAFDALNSTNGSIISNLGAMILSLFVMVMLALVFIVIFLNLLKNYFKIMFPFAFSPLLLVFFVFPSLRPISIKAFNIVMDGILKQACMLFSIKVASTAFYQALNTLNTEISFSGMILLIVLSLSYRELIAVAEGISSELIGTQNLGNPESMGLLRTAAVLGGAAGLMAKGTKGVMWGVSKYKDPSSKVGAIMRGGVKGFGKGFNTFGNLLAGFEGWGKKQK